MSKLHIPSGTKDSWGKSAKLREHVLTQIRKLYELYCFEPLHTPTIEYANVFDGHHGEGEKLLFNLSDSHGEKLVLRYDLTVPLARFWRCSTARFVVYSSSRSVLRPSLSDGPALTHAALRSTSLNIS